MNVILLWVFKLILCRRIKFFCSLFVSFTLHAAYNGDNFRLPHAVEVTRQKTFKMLRQINSRELWRTPVIQLPGDLGSLNGLKVGFLGAGVLCRSGVHAKFGVMGNTGESEFSRLVREKRTGQGSKHSRQKLPRQTVVDSTCE